MSTLATASNRFKHLLWADCTAGAIVGIAVLMLHTWISDWYNLPKNILLFTGVANVLYACYSFSLAINKKRKRIAIIILIIANASWVLVCIYLAITHWMTANFLGIGHLLLEALFVGWLACLEWRYIDVLLE